MNVLRKTQKYVTFSVPIEKKVRKAEKDGNQDITTISCKIKFINSPRFMQSSLSNLVDNLTEGIHKIKCNDYNCFLEYQSVNDNLIKCKCLSCKKIIQITLMKNRKIDSRVNSSFLITILINSFCCLEKVLILANKWMGGKSLIKHNYIKNKIFTVF